MLKKLLAVLYFSVFTNLYAAELEIIAAIDKLAKILDQEYQFVSQDEFAKNIVAQQQNLLKNLHNFKNSENFKKLKHKQEIIYNLRKSHKTLTFEQGQAIERLKKDIQDLVPESVRSWRFKLLKLNKLLCQKLKSYNAKILKNNRSILSMLNKNLNPDINQALSRLEQANNKLKNYGNIKLEVSPCVFISQEDFVDNTIQAVKSAITAKK